MPGVGVAGAFKAEVVHQHFQRKMRLKLGTLIDGQRRRPVAERNPDECGQFLADKGGQPWQQACVRRGDNARVVGPGVADAVGSRVSVEGIFQLRLGQLRILASAQDFRQVQLWRIGLQLVGQAMPTFRIGMEADMVAEDGNLARSFDRGCPAKEEKADRPVLS